MRAATSPLGELTGPEEVAEVAVWFLEGASKVTGYVMMVDAGNHLVGRAPLKAR